MTILAVRSRRCRHRPGTHRRIPGAIPATSAARGRPRRSDPSRRRATSGLASDSPASRLSDRIGHSMVRLLESTGLVDLGRLGTRLRALGKPVEAHVFEKLLGGIAGFVVPIVFSLVLTAGGVPVSPALTVGLAAIDVACRVPVSRPRAVRPRSSAGGVISVTHSPPTSTSSPSSSPAEVDWRPHSMSRPTSEMDGHSLRSARRFAAPGSPAKRHGRCSTTSARNSASTSCASSQPQRTSPATRALESGRRLAAKADSMRANQTAAIEAQAEAATEKMLLPVVTLVVGMILFIGFGVVQAISTPGTVP